jgi:regulator of cell morphogenesis and NO signaling
MFRHSLPLQVENDMVASTQSIREIVSVQASAAAILERFDIDLCSQADESLTEACAALQLSVDQVLEKLADAAANEHGAAPVDPAGYSLSRLIQYIVRTHHQYVRRELPRLALIASRVAAKHENRAPELKKLQELTALLAAEMFAHLDKEEQILFPFIAEMEQDAAACNAPQQPCFHTVARSVSMMIVEHGMAEARVAEIRKLTNGFETPAWACPTFTALYAGLREFAADLRQHVHLENDALLPRAIDLEAELNLRGQL